MIDSLGHVFANILVYPAPSPLAGKPDGGWVLMQFKEKWSTRLGRLAEIATDPATTWIEHTVRRYGEIETLTLALIDSPWEPLGAETPVRVILAQDHTKPTGYQLALITTDLTSPPQIVERYSDPVVDRGVLRGSQTPSRRR